MAYTTPPRLVGLPDINRNLPTLEQLTDINRDIIRTTGYTKSSSRFRPPETPESNLFNYNDPMEINSPLDLLQNAVTGGFRQDYDSGISVFGSKIEDIPLLRLIPDSIDYLRRGWIKPLTQMKQQEGVLDQTKIPFTDWTPFKYIPAGVQVTALNTLMALGETLDITALPVKYAIKTLTGTEKIKATQGTSGRSNYDWDTGNIWADIGLEVLSDTPAMIATFGSKALISTGVAGSKVAVRSAVKSAVSQLGAEISEATIDNISRRALKIMSQSKITPADAIRQAIVANQPAFTVAEDVVKTAAKDKLTGMSIAVLKGLQNISAATEAAERAVLHTAFHGTIPMTKWAFKNAKSYIMPFFRNHLHKQLEPLMSNGGHVDITQFDKFNDIINKEVKTFNERLDIAEQLNGEELRTAYLQDALHKEYQNLNSILYQSTKKYPEISPDDKINYFVTEIQEKLGVAPERLIEVLTELNIKTEGKHTKQLERLQSLLSNDIQQELYKRQNFAAMKSINQFIREIEQLPGTTAVQKTTLIDNYITERTGLASDEWIAKLRELDPEGLESAARKYELYTTIAKYEERHAKFLFEEPKRNLIATYSQIKTMVDPLKDTLSPQQIALVVNDFITTRYKKPLVKFITEAEELNEIYGGEISYLIKNLKQYTVGKAVAKAQSEQLNKMLETTTFYIRKLREKSGIFTGKEVTNLENWLVENYGVSLAEFKHMIDVAPSSIRNRNRWLIQMITRAQDTWEYVTRSHMEFQRQKLGEIANEIQTNWLLNPMLDYTDKLKLLDTYIAQNHPGYETFEDYITKLKELAEQHPELLIGYPEKLLNLYKRVQRQADLAKRLQHSTGLVRQYEIQENDVSRLLKPFEYLEQKIREAAMNLLDEADLQPSKIHKFIQGMMEGIEVIDSMPEYLLIKASVGLDPIYSKLQNLLIKQMTVEEIPNIKASFKKIQDMINKQIDKLQDLRHEVNNLVEDEGPIGIAATIKEQTQLHNLEINGKRIPAFRNNFEALRSVLNSEKFKKYSQEGYHEEVMTSTSNKMGDDIEAIYSSLTEMLLGFDDRAITRASTALEQHDAIFRGIERFRKNWDLPFNVEAFAKNLFELEDAFDSFLTKYDVHSGPMLDPKLEDLSVLNKAIIATRNYLGNIINKAKEQNAKAGIPEDWTDLLTMLNEFDYVAKVESIYTIKHNGGVMAVKHDNAWTSAALIADDDVMKIITGLLDPGTDIGAAFAHAQSLLVTEEQQVIFKQFQASVQTFYNYLDLWKQLYQTDDVFKEVRPDIKDAFINSVQWFARLNPLDYADRPEALNQLMHVLYQKIEDHIYVTTLKMPLNLKEQKLELLLKHPELKNVIDGDGNLLHTAKYDAKIVYYLAEHLLSDELPRTTNINRIAFDLETTDINGVIGEIKQIGAFSGNREFEVTTTTLNMPPEGAIVRMFKDTPGFTPDDPQGFYQKVFENATDTELQAMLNFTAFLQTELGKGKPVQLLAHNGGRFDKQFLLSTWERMYVDGIATREMYVEGVAALKQCYFIDTLQELKKKHGYPAVTEYEKDAIGALFKTYVERQAQIAKDVQLKTVPLLQPLDPQMGGRFLELKQIIEDANKVSANPLKEATLLDFTGHLQEAARTIFETFQAIKKDNRSIGIFFDRTMFEDAGVKELLGSNYTQAMNSLFRLTGQPDMIPGIKQYAGKNVILDDVINRYFDVPYGSDVLFTEAKGMTTIGKLIEANRGRIKNGYLLRKYSDQLNGLYQKTMQILRAGEEAPAIFKKFRAVPVTDYATQYTILRYLYRANLKELEPFFREMMFTNEAMGLVFNEMKVFRKDIDDAAFAHLKTANDEVSELVKSHYKKLYAKTPKKKVERYKKISDEFKKHFAYIYQRQVDELLEIPIEQLSFKQVEELAEFDAALNKYFHTKMKTLKRSPKKMTRYLQFKQDQELEMYNKLFDEEQELKAKVAEATMAYHAEKQKMYDELFTDENLAQVPEEMNRLRQEAVEKDHAVGLYMNAQLKRVETLEKFYSKDIITDGYDPLAFAEAVKEMNDYFASYTDPLKQYAQSLTERDAFRAVIQRRSNIVTSTKRLLDVLHEKVKGNGTLEVENLAKHNEFMETLTTHADSLAYQETMQIVSLEADKLQRVLAHQAHRLITFRLTDFLDKDAFRTTVADLLARRAELKHQYGIIVKQQGDRFYIGLHKNIDARKLDYFPLQPLNLESAASVLDPELAQAMKDAGEDIFKFSRFFKNEFDYYLSSGSLGGVSNKEFYEAVYDKLPKDIREAIGDWVPNEATKDLKALSFNFSSLGKLSSRRDLIELTPSNLISVYKNTATYLSKALHTAGQFLQLATSPDLAIGTGALGDIAKNNPEVLLEALRTSSEFKLCVVVEDSSARWGARVMEVVPETVADIQEALRLNATIQTYQTYSKMFETVNNFGWSNTGLKYWARIIQVYKTGFLAMPGAVMRNLVDVVIKNAVMTQEPVGMFKYYGRAMNLFVKYDATLKGIIREWDNRNLPEMTFHDAVEAYFKRTDSKMSKEEYQFVHDFFEDGPAAALAKPLEKFYRRGVQESLWEKSRHQLNWLTAPNKNIEQIGRFAEYLLLVEKRGMSDTAAFKVVADTHFDYALKEQVKKGVELIFPFYTFRMNNFMFWVEQMEKNPWLAPLYSNIMTPSWNFDEWDQYELERNKSLQSFILSGNLMLADNNLTLKTTFSVMDPFNMVTNLPEAIWQGMSVPKGFAETMEAAWKAITTMTTPSEEILYNLPLLGSELYGALQGGDTVVERTGFDAMKWAKYVGGAGVLGGVKRFKPYTPKGRRPKKPTKKLKKFKKFTKFKPAKRSQYYRNFEHRNTKVAMANFATKIYSKKGTDLNKLRSLPISPKILQYRIKDMYNYNRISQIRYYR